MGEIIGIVGLLMTMVFGVSFACVMVGMKMMKDKFVIYSVWMLFISGSLVLFLFILSLIASSPYYNVTCTRDNEVVYVETTQIYPDVEDYDSCYIEVVTEE